MGVWGFGALGVEGLWRFGVLGFGGLGVWGAGGVGGFGCWGLGSRVQGFSSSGPVGLGNWNPAGLWMKELDAKPRGGKGASKIAWGQKSFS